MLQPSTLKFLKDLGKHNNKPWFEAHRAQYLAAKEDFEELVIKLIAALGKVDENILGLDVKDCTFRIYKDVRFSKDKTPYKTNMGAGFNLGGKKVHFPGYYFHLEPGGYSFAGGGMWMPMAPELKKIRQEIDYNLEEFEKIILDKNFQKTFGQLQDEGALSRPPLGYNAKNPAIEYLKMKSFVVSVGIDDRTLTSPQLISTITRAFTLMKPFVHFLQRALE